MILCLRSRKPILQKATPHFPHNVRYWTNNFFVMIHVYLITHCITTFICPYPHPLAHQKHHQNISVRCSLQKFVYINLNFVAWSCSGGPEVHAHLCRPEENGILTVKKLELPKHKVWRQRLFARYCKLHAFSKGNK